MQSLGNLMLLHRPKAGPRDHLGPRAIWDPGPFGTRDHLGPGPIWDQGHLGPKDHLGPRALWVPVGPLAKLITGLCFAL